LTAVAASYICPVRGKGMIPKSAIRISDQIMLRRES